MSIIPGPMNNQTTTDSKRATPAGSVNVWKRPLPPQVTQPKRKVSGPSVPARPAAPKRAPPTPSATVTEDFPMLSSVKVKSDPKSAVISGAWNRSVKPVPPSSHALSPVTSAATTSEPVLSVSDPTPAHRPDLFKTSSADAIPLTTKTLRKTAKINSLGLPPTRRAPVSLPVACASARKTSATSRLSVASARTSINARRASANRKTSTTRREVPVVTATRKPSHADVEGCTVQGGQAVTTYPVVDSGMMPAKLAQRHIRHKIVLVADVFSAIESFAKRAPQSEHSTEAVLRPQDQVQGVASLGLLPRDEPVLDGRDTPQLMFDADTTAGLSDEETPPTPVYGHCASPVRAVRSEMMKAVIEPAVHHRRLSLDNAPTRSVQAPGSLPADEASDSEPLALVRAQSNYDVDASDPTSLSSSTPPPAALAIPQLDRFAFRRLSRGRSASAHSLIRHLGQKAYRRALKAATPVISLAAAPSLSCSPTNETVQLPPLILSPTRSRLDQVGQSEASGSAKVDATFIVSLPVAHPPDPDRDELDNSHVDDESTDAPHNLGLPVAVLPTQSSPYSGHDDRTGAREHMNLDTSPNTSPVVGLPIATSPMQLEAPLHESLHPVIDVETREPLSPEPEVDFEGWEGRWNFEEPDVREEMSRAESSLQPLEEVTHILLWRQSTERLQAAEWAAAEHELKRPPVATSFNPWESAPALDCALVAPLPTLPTFKPFTELQDLASLNLQRTPPYSPLELYDAETQLRDCPPTLERAPAQLPSAWVEPVLPAHPHSKLQRVPATLHHLSVDFASNHRMLTPPPTVDWSSQLPSTPDSLPPLHTHTVARSGISSLHTYNNSLLPLSVNRYLAALPEFDTPPPANGDTSRGCLPVDISLELSPAYLLPFSLDSDLDPQADESPSAARTALIKSSTPLFDNQPLTSTRSSNSRPSSSSASSVLSLTSQEGAEVHVLHSAEGVKQDRLSAINKVSLWLQNEHQHYRYAQDANIGHDQREDFRELKSETTVHWSVGRGRMGLVDGGVFGGW